MNMTRTKIIKLAVVLKDQDRHLYVYHPLLNTPPQFDNKRDYKGDTHDETPDSSTKYTNVKKKDYANLKRNLDK